MSAVAPELLVGVEDYLLGERESDVRHEFINGRVYAMVGTTVTHNIVAGNLFALIHGALSEAPCQVFMADVKARIHTADEDFFFYPDLMVACDPEDQNPYYRQHPCLVVEVLSPSTERMDRADKFFAYRKLPSLQEYVLIAQDTYRVEVYRRSTQWDLEIYGEGETFRLACADNAFQVSDVYAGTVPEAG